MDTFLFVTFFSFSFCSLYLKKIVKWIFSPCALNHRNINSVLYMKKILILASESLLTTIMFYLCIFGKISMKILEDTSLYKMWHVFPQDSSWLWSSGNHPIQAVHIYPLVKWKLYLIFIWACTIVTGNCLLYIKLFVFLSIDIVFF